MKKQKIVIILLSVIAVVAIVFASVLFYQKRQNDSEQQMIQEKINEVQTMLDQFHNETNQIEQLVIMKTTEYMSEVNSQYGEVTLAYDSALLEMNIAFSDYIEDLIASNTFEDLSTKEKEKLNEAIENLNSIKVLGIYDKVNNEDKSYDVQIDSLIDSYQTRIAEIEIEQEAEQAEQAAEQAEKEARIAEEESTNARIAREAEYENKIEENKIAEGTDDIPIYQAVIETYNNLLAEILADGLISNGEREILSGKINALIAQYNSELDTLITIGRMNAMAVSP